MSKLTQAQRALHTTLPMAKLEAISLPDVPQIQLYLINADFPTGPLPADVMHAVIKNPAYWAFCWGSGLALAQWLLDNPNSVEGKVVADVGCGSGVVAIAAKIAGAKQVIACDNDPDALLATQANAELNNVSLDYQSDLLALPYVEQILMADVLYDRANFALIRLAKQKTHNMLIADSRVTDVEDQEFSIVHKMNSLTYPNLGEFDEFKNVQFFSWASN